MYLGALFVDLFASQTAFELQGGFFRPGQLGFGLGQCQFMIRGFELRHHRLALLHHIAFFDVEAHREAGDFCAERRRQVRFYGANDGKFGGDRLFDHLANDDRGWSARMRLGDRGQGEHQTAKERHYDEYPPTTQQENER